MLLWIALLILIIIIFGFGFIVRWLLYIGIVLFIIWLIAILVRSMRGR